MKAIGVFGGTFAPIHNGHLRLALELREHLGLAQVRIVPCGAPPHRAAPMLPPRRRLEWIKLAIADEPGLVADDRELKRAGPSYTVDTLAELRAELDRESGPDAPICLLLGDDAANQFHTWHRWQEIARLAHLVFAERPYEPPAPAPELAGFLRGRRAHATDELLQTPAGRWLALSIPPLAISSTRIRRLLKAGRSIRGLVPESVIRNLTPEDIAALTRDEEAAID